MQLDFNLIKQKYLTVDKYHERESKFQCEYILVSGQEREFTWAVKESESKFRVEWCGKYLEYFVKYGFKHLWQESRNQET